MHKTEQKLHNTLIFLLKHKKISPAAAIRIRKIGREFVKNSGKSPARVEGVEESNE